MQRPAVLLTLIALAVCVLLVSASTPPAVVARARAMATAARDRIAELRLPVDPTTGLRALGIVGGRPVWPIAGGAVDTFIPEVFTAKINVAKKKNLVLADSGPNGSVNTDYEGEIKQRGDTVHIGTLSRPTISNYVKNVTVINPQTLAMTDDTLLIDQSKYFAFELDDVDKRQVQDGGQLMSKAASEAAEGLAEAADTFIGTIMVADATTVLPAQDVTTAAGAFGLLVRMRTTLDRLLVPQAGRWVAVSPEFYGLLLHDERFTDASKYGSNRAIVNGEVGTALGFTIKVTTNLPTGTAGGAGEVSSYIIAGHKIATTYAEQIRNVEAYRPESAFSDAVKGLHLYGGKVVDGDALVVCDVDVTLPA